MYLANFMVAVLKALHMEPSFTLGSRTCLVFCTGAAKSLHAQITKAVVTAVLQCGAVGAEHGDDGGAEQCSCFDSLGL